VGLRDRWLRAAFAPLHPDAIARAASLATVIALPASDDGMATSCTGGVAILIPHSDPLVSLEIRVSVSLFCAGLTTKRTGACSYHDKIPLLGCLCARRLPLQTCGSPRGAPAPLLLALGAGQFGNEAMGEETV
jgi:hypothetical protein